MRCNVFILTDRWSMAFTKAPSPPIVQHLCLISLVESIPGHDLVVGGGPQPFKTIHPCVSHTLIKHDGAAHFLLPPVTQD